MLISLTQSFIENGRVVSFGDNQFGQLGLGKDQIDCTSLPTEIPGLCNIVAISANHHSAAIG